MIYKLLYFAVLQFVQPAILNFKELLDSIFLSSCALIATRVVVDEVFLVSFDRFVKLRNGRAIVGRQMLS